jgi:hypothetical protein
MVQEEEKDTYEFQKARVCRLAEELGKQVKFDDTVTCIKFRVTGKGEKFGANVHSGDFLPDLSPNELADKPDSWLRSFIIQLAGSGTAR